MESKNYVTNDRQEEEKHNRAIASQTCDEISRVFLSNNVGNHENYESLSLAYRKYTNLTPAQIRFFPNKQMLHDLEDTLKKAKNDYDNFNIASEAERKARAIVSGIHHADEDDRDKLKKAHRYYKELSPGQQEYFSADLLREIKRLKDEADRDYEIRENRREIEKIRREEEERRRRAQAHRSSGLSPTFSGPSYNGGSNSHRAGGSSSKPSVGSSHKASTPMKHAVRPSGTSISHSVNSGHGGKPSGGGARLTKH